MFLYHKDQKGEERHWLTIRPGTKEMVVFITKPLQNQGKRKTESSFKSGELNVNIKYLTSQFKHKLKI